MKRNIKVISAVLGIVLLTSMIYSQSVDALNRSKIEQKVLAMTEGKEFDMTRVIVRYKDVNYSGASVASVDGKIIAQVKVVDTNKDLEAQNYASATANNIKNVQDILIQLLSDPNVEYAEPNYLSHTSAWVDAGTTTTPSNDYSPANHWYYTNSNVPEAWDDQSCAAGGAGCGGDSNVIVAVIDTGLAFENYDDSGIYGYTDKNFTAVGADYNPSNGFNIYVNTGEIPGDGKDNDCNGIIDDYNGFDALSWFTYSSEYYYYPGRSTQDFCSGTTPYDYSAPTNLKYRKMGHPVDTYGHGSYVTGLISGIVDNVSTTGSVSPSHNVTIMPISVNMPFSGSMWTSEVLSGIYYAAAHGADVINMSLGGSGYSQSMQDAVNYANINGVVVVAASGNYGINTVSYPAALDNVIAVGSVNSDDYRSTYSQYGSTLDIVAYVGQGNTAGNATWQETLSCTGDRTVVDSHDWGCNNASTFDGTQTEYGIGTSYASPQVAAAAALVRSVNPDISVKQITSLLTGTAKDITMYGTGWDAQTGYGVLDFENLNIETTNNSWLSATTLGYTITTPDMIEFGGDLYVFKTGSDYSLKMNIFNGATWAGWSTIGYTTAPPTTSVLGGDLYVAKKGVDGSVKVKSFNGTVWTEWTELGGVTLSNPVLSVYGTDLYISKRGALNELKLKSFDGSTWSDWEDIGYAISPPAMIEYSSDFYIFKRGTNESLSVNMYDGSTWSGWADVGGVTSNTPVASLHNGLLYVAKRGGDNGLKLQSYNGFTWSGWTVIGNAKVSPAISTFGGDLFVAKNGADGSLRTTYYDNIAWADAWNHIGGISSKPVLLEYNADLYVLKQGADGQLVIMKKN